MQIEQSDVECHQFMRPIVNIISHWINKFLHYIMIFGISMGYKYKFVADFLT